MRSSMIKSTVSLAPLAYMIIFSLILKRLLVETCLFHKGGLLLLERENLGDIIAIWFPLAQRVAVTIGKRNAFKLHQMTRSSLHEVWGLWSKRSPQKAERSKETEDTHERGFCHHFALCWFSFSSHGQLIGGQPPDKASLRWTVLCT